MTATWRTLAGGSPPDPRRGHLILVGIPGCGKTTVGRRLARRLGRPFLDFDNEIECREGATVAEIFAARGERYFREQELELTRELAATGGMVLAPGGGWIMNEGASALLRPPGRIVYLEVAPGVALKRMGRGRQKRPLLRHPDPLAELRRLLAEREQSYRSADIVVSTDIVSLQQVAQLVARLASTVEEG